MRIIVPLVLVSALLVAVYAMGSGLVKPDPSPQDYAYAGWIDTQADMDVARQSAALAQANALAQAQAQALIIEAQARADAQRASANTWAIVAALIIGAPLIILAIALLLYVRRVNQPQKQVGQIHFDAIPMSGGRWKVVDQYGNWRILDWHNRQDAKMIERLER